MRCVGLRAVVAAGMLGTLWTLGPAQGLVVEGAVTGGSAHDRGGRFVALVPPFAASRPPNAVGADTFENANLYAFDEDQNIRIDRPVAVDIGRRPEEGTVVASHYVFFDPGPAMTQDGFVRFDAPIIGVATARATLEASDWLANTGVTYLNPGLRGLEATDRVWIDPDDPFRLLLRWWAQSPGDYIRVFTEASPAFVEAAGAARPMRQSETEPGRGRAPRHASMPSLTDLRR